MRAITVQQPWAWAIIHGGKNVENRTQLWKYRGPLAIHAGQRWSERGAAASVVVDAFARSGANPLDVEMVQRYGLDPQETGGFPRGAIIGIVDLVDVHPEAGCCAPWGEATYAGKRGITHLVLENPRELPPIPYKGKLGLWTPDEWQLERLKEYA